MRNKDVAELLYEIAQLLSLGNESIFRIRAYERASQVIESLTEPVENLTRDKKLCDIPGIGEGIAEKIADYLDKGKSAYIDELKKKFPAGLLEIMKIQGMGPKKAKVLFDKLKIESVAELRKAAQAGKIRSLPGFGKKSEDNILQGITLVERSAERVLLSEALPLSEELIGQLKKDKNVIQIAAAGSLRRYKETIGDIDILASAARGKTNEVIERFTNLPSAERLLAKGGTKASIIASGGRQVDLRIVDDTCFGAALQYFTGSKEHNVALRSLARQKGFTINEYGIFRLTNTKKPVACKTEEEIYKTLGLEYIPPQLREDRGEIEAAAKGALPRLLELKDIKGDIHVHSNYSDGLNTIEEMALKAQNLGYEWIIFCDHSQSLKVARGLSIETLRRKMDEIGEFNAKHRGIRALCGVELDILAHGGLDYPGSVLEKLDFVLASIHTGFKQPELQITNRIVAAIESPYVNCIAHPTGRLLNKRNPYPVNMERVLEAARKNGKSIEINSFPERLDLYDTYCKKAKEMGIRLSIGTDSHTYNHLEFMSLGVAVARRGWLEKKDVINTMSYKELVRHLKTQRDQESEKVRE